MDNVKRARAKFMEKWFVLAIATIGLLLLLPLPVAIAANYDPGTFPVGTLIDQNLIVNQDESSQHYVREYLSDVGHGRLVLKPVSVTVPFDLVVKYDKRSWDDSGIYVAAGGSSIGFWCDRTSVYFEGTTSTGWYPYTKNTLRLAVTSTTATLYINEVFFKTVTLSVPNATYTAMVVDGIAAEDRLYEVEVNGNPLPIGTAPNTNFDIILASKTVGSLVDQNLTVNATAANEKYLREYLSDVGHGRLRLKPVSLTAPFELVVNYDKRSWDDSTIYMAAGGASIGFWCDRYTVGFGDSSTGTGWYAYTKNTLRLAVTSTTATLYINEVFFKTVTLSVPNATYTAVVVDGIAAEDRLYEVGVVNKNPLPIGSPYPFDFDLNLDTYPVGAVLNENLIVKQAVNNEKYFSGYTGTGRLTRPQMILAAPFDLVVNYDKRSWDDSTIYMAAGGTSIGFWCDRYTVGFGGSSTSSGWYAYTKNTLRLAVTGTTATLYINEVFFKTVTLSVPNVTYTTLVIDGITQDDRLYESGGKNLSPSYLLWTK